MIRAIQFVAFALAALSPVLGLADPILYDFETGTEGWQVDWGLKSEPTNTAGRARHGSRSMVLNHRFGKNSESVGVKVPFSPPKDFTQNPGFEGLSAWVYFPSGDEWQAQLYAHCGSEWKWSVGTLHERLQPGWHRIFIAKSQLGDCTSVRDIGVQIKNYKLSGEAAIHIDRVEILATSKP